MFALGWSPLALFALLALLPAAPAAPRRVPVGPGVSLEVDGERRRVVVEASVVLRRGVLEGLLTRAKKKEHEYILAADVDARHVHAALELARARKGSPVQFSPRFAPPTGSAIRVELRYIRAGKPVAVSAREWVRDGKTGKPLAHDWVFAGSRFGPHPEGDDRPPYYLANHGDLICLCNMEMALLDLPVRSPKALNDRLYEANTQRIPPAGTRVEVVLEPADAPGKRP